MSYAYRKVSRKHDFQNTIDETFLIIYSLPLLTAGHRLPFVCAFQHSLEIFYPSTFLFTVFLKNNFVAHLGTYQN